jgi:predicted PurR-regulated permease PerM
MIVIVIVMILVILVMMMIMMMIMMIMMNEFADRLREILNSVTKYLSVQKDNEKTISTQSKLKMLIDVMKPKTTKTNATIAELIRSYEE